MPVSLASNAVGKSIQNSAPKQGSAMTPTAPPFRSVTQLTIHFIQQRLVRQITPEVFGEDLENIIIITR